MDARTGETVAVALGHAPHSGLLCQVLAGLGPAYTTHLRASTPAVEATGSLRVR